MEAVVTTGGTTDVVGADVADVDVVGSAVAWKSGNVCDVVEAARLVWPEEQAVSARVALRATSARMQRRMGRIET